jgi:type II secretory pathway pseudopilin PulG
MTLLEIMIVLAILGLIMGLVVGPKVMAYYRASQRKVATLAVHKLADQDYTTWAVSHASQHCPAGLADLALTSTTPTDPWGSEYKMHCGATAPPVEGVAFGASSFGEDTREGTTDDIVSWRDSRDGQ